LNSQDTPLPGHDGELHALNTPNVASPNSHSPGSPTNLTPITSSVVEKTCRTHNSVNAPTATNAKLTQLHYYNDVPHWKQLIEQVKIFYHVSLSLNDSFLNKKTSLREADECLNEVHGNYIKNEIKLEEGVCLIHVCENLLNSLSL
jgi:hypothetical protein